MLIKTGHHPLKVMLSVILMVLLTACDQPPAVADINNNNDAILQELKQIRLILERIDKKTQPAQAKQQATPTTAQLSIKNRPTMGKNNAPITIVEVSDYQCPYCVRFFNNTFSQLKKEYIDTGKAKLVFKNLPLSFHKNARKAAQAAHCAGDQGKYWQMHDTLFQNAKRLDEKYLIEHAQSIQLDEKEFNACLNSKKHLAAIDSDARESNQAGLTGTPSFVIGKTKQDVIKGSIVRGAQPFASLKIIIDKQLKLINKLPKKIKD